MPTFAQTPFEQALTYSLSKALLPTEAGTTELSQLPAEVRNRARFSARTTDAGYLAEMDRLLNRYVSPAAAGPDAIDAATVRAELKKELLDRGYAPDPKQAGGLRDLSSDRRLDLIIKTNTEMAQGYGEHIKSQDPDLLDLYPARELYRLEQREEPRNWIDRWVRAGGKLYEGRMIARVDDAIWTSISRFGNPYPPFDFNSGMWTRKIGRKLAERLGVITRATVVQPTIKPINQAVEAPMPGNISAGLREAIEAAFQGLAIIRAGKILLEGAA